MNLRQLFSRSKNARALAAGSIALAAGSIVLLRAPHSTTAAPAPTRGFFTAPPSVVRTVVTATGAPRSTFTGPGTHGSIALTQGAVEANGTREVFAEVRDRKSTRLNSSH